MRLSMISRIIQTDVNVICRSEAEADNIDRGLNNSWCHAKAESNNCFIIHLKTSETYKTIKQNLVMFQVYLFYFRALLSLSCWPCRGLGTTASNNIFFGCKFDPKKLLLDAEHVSTSAAEITYKLAYKYRTLRIIRCSLTNQEREYILNV
jgi:hypothetical protein